MDIIHSHTETYPWIIHGYPYIVYSLDIHGYQQTMRDEQSASSTQYTAQAPPPKMGGNGTVPPHWAEIDFFLPFRDKK